MKNTNINSINNTTYSINKGEITMKKTTIRHRITAIILAAITAISVSAFVTTSASAAEANEPSTTTVSQEEQKKIDFEELGKAKDGKEALEILKKIIDRKRAEAKAEKEAKEREADPDPYIKSDSITVSTADGDKFFNSFEEAWKEAITQKESTIKMHCDQNNIHHLTVPGGVKVNINMATNSINANGETLFTVESGGYLSIYNGSINGASTAVNALDNFTLNKVKITGATEGAVKAREGVKAYITNCVFENNYGGNGGALYLPNSSDESVIRDNTFINNTAYFDGGGAYVNATIEKCVFKQNTSGGNGGGLYISSGHKGWIRDCVFENNTANCNGGGFYVGEQKFNFDNINVNNNTAGGNGGGVYIAEDKDTTIRGIKAYGNSAIASGGGIYVSDHSFLSVFAMDVQNNTASDKGGGIYLGALCGKDHEFTRVTVANNKAAVGGGVYCNAGWAKAADVRLSHEIDVRDNENSNFYLVKDCGKKAVLYTENEFCANRSCVYVNSSESGERAVVELKEKDHESAFHGDNGRTLERGNFFNYTLYIQ